MLKGMSEVSKALECLSSGLDMLEKLAVELCAFTFVMNALDPDLQTKLDDELMGDLDLTVKSLTERLMRDRKGTLAKLKELYETEALTLEQLRTLCAT